MAGALIPLVATVAPPLINLIAGLVHKAAPIAEQKHGPGTGPVKFSDVFNSVIVSLQNAALAGQIDKTLPPDDVIKTIIQAVVSSMQLSGVLEPPAPLPPSGISVLKIVGGTLQVQPQLNNQT